MTCPVCGDEIVNGKCRFCGYEATESDRKAREKYEAQKAAFESGSDVRNTRSGDTAREPDRSGKPPGKDRKKPAVKKPSDKKPESKGQSDRKPAPKKASSNSKRKRPGFFKRWFFKLLVFGWIILYILAVIGRFSKGPDFNKPGPDSDINNIGQVETLPGEGGARDARE